MTSGKICGPATGKHGCARRSADRGLVREFSRAFTLIEVLVAMAVFFMAIFSILALTSQSLRGARALQLSGPGAGMLAAEFASITNRLEEGMESGNFGEAYPDYSWKRDVYQVSTNGLFRADFWVLRDRGNESEEPTLSVLLFRPDSVVGARTGP